MDVGASELFRGDFFASYRFDEWGATEEDRARCLNDPGLVRHRWHVRAARRARTHHDRDLRDSQRRHARLIEEDSAKMILVRKDLSLHR